MRKTDNVFHLAIPCADLKAMTEYYNCLPDCSVARSYEDRITVNFFGDQVVCHLSPKDVDKEPKMYPRHFGVTFRTREDFDRVYQGAKERNLPFFEELFVRFEGMKEEHRSFFLCDPANNLLEFKFYNSPEMMY